MTTNKKLNLSLLLERLFLINYYKTFLFLSSFPLAKAGYKLVATKQFLRNLYKVNCTWSQI